MPPSILHFGPVWSASGACGFAGEGYFWHNWSWPFRPDFAGATFVAKTTTLCRRAGNMPLRDNVPFACRLDPAAYLRPVARFPRCIKADFRRAAAVNAVGLSNPGLEAILDTGLWQARRDPFLLSFAAVGKTPAARLDEVRAAADMLRLVLPRHTMNDWAMQAAWGLEINLSCPTREHKQSDVVDEGLEFLSVFGAALPGVPLLPKINCLIPCHQALRLAKHPACAGLVVSNTLPYGCAPDDAIDWGRLWGGRSPLAGVPLPIPGEGGLSGAPLLPVVQGWLAVAAQLYEFPVPVVAGGGIMRPADALSLFEAGRGLVVAVQLGSVAFLRPWRVASIIRAVRAARS